MLRAILPNEPPVRGRFGNVVAGFVPCYGMDLEGPALSQAVCAHEDQYRWDRERLESQLHHQIERLGNNKHEPMYNYHTHIASFVR